MLPRLFRIAPERCHSLSSRLAVKGVMFAVLASCSFVTSIRIPDCTLRPIPCAREFITCVKRSRALLAMSAVCAAMNHAM